MSTVFIWENQDGSIDACELDIYETETHNMTNEITEFPVEAGPDVSDNIRPTPRTLVLEGYVSDSPSPFNNMAGKYGGSFQLKDLQLPGKPTYQQKTVKLDLPGKPINYNLGSVATAGFGALKGALGLGPSDEVQVFQRVPDKAQEGKAVVWTWDHWESHAAEAFRLLKKAWETKALVQCITDLETYDSMAVESVVVPRKSEDGAGAPFSVSLKHVLVRSAKSVDAPKPAEPIAQKVKSLGSKSGKEDPNEAEHKRKTALKAAADKALTYSNPGYTP
jgi:hypothetical protein